MSVLVAGLPGSRTAWLATALTLPHEGATKSEDQLDYFSMIEQVGGDCTTLLPLMMKTPLMRAFDRIVWVDRGIADCADSVTRRGLDQGYGWEGIFCTLVEARKKVEEFLNSPEWVNRNLMVRFEDLDARMPEIRKFVGHGRDNLYARDRDRELANYSVSRIKPYTQEEQDNIHAVLEGTTR